MKNIKIITLIVIVLISFSSFAKNAEERNLFKNCSDKRANSIVVEKRNGQHRVIITRVGDDNKSINKMFYPIFIRGNKFAITLDTDYWIPSITYSNRKADLLRYKLTRKKTVANIRNLEPQALVHGAEEAMIFRCNMDTSYQSTGLYVEIDISIDTYELLIAQPWLSF
jgi:hypothetical protein